jgi:hypothetical protein
MEGIPFFQAVCPSKVLTIWYENFDLCESSTDYVWSFIAYTGKDIDLQPLPISRSMIETPFTISQLLINS